MELRAETGLTRPGAGAWKMPETDPGPVLSGIHCKNLRDRLPGPQTINSLTVLEVACHKEMHTFPAEAYEK